MQVVAPDTIRSTRRLLACGIASGVVFFVVAIAQARHNSLPFATK
jgi:hypothetical protein